MYAIPHSFEIRTFYCLSTKYIFCLSSVGRLNKNRRDGWATSVRPSSPPRPTYLVRWPRCLTRAELLQQPAYLTQGCIMSVPLPRKNLKIWFFFSISCLNIKFFFSVAFYWFDPVNLFFKDTESSKTTGCFPRWLSVHLQSRSKWRRRMYAVETT